MAWELIAEARFNLGEDFLHAPIGNQEFKAGSVTLRAVALVTVQLLIALATGQASSRETHTGRDLARCGELESPPPTFTP